MYVQYDGRARLSSPVFHMARQGNCMLAVEPGENSEEVGVVEGGAEVLGGEAALGGALLAQQVEGEVTRDREVRGPVADAHPALVLAEDDIQYPVDAVLNGKLAVEVHGSAHDAAFFLARGMAEREAHRTTVYEEAAWTVRVVTDRDLNEDRGRTRKWLRQAIARPEQGTLW